MPVDVCWCGAFVFDRMGGLVMFQRTPSEQNCTDYHRLGTEVVKQFFQIMGHDTAVS